MFQLQREEIEPSTHFSLWQKCEANELNKVYVHTVAYSCYNNVTNENFCRFRHVITGKKTATPHPDNLGGILADEMGLGKTLTMLATILATLDSSKTFRATKANLRDSPAALTHRGGTLVVVPSASKGSFLSFKY